MNDDALVPRAATDAVACNDQNELDLASELFHRINRVVPENQEVVSIPATCTVRDATKLMIERGFSQVPVLAGDEVIGVFSFRSFAREAAYSSLDDLKKQRSAIGDLRVDEFLEDFRYARVTEEIDGIFDVIDRDNGLLIGTPEKLIGILTPMDILKYLHRVSAPFILISEIELAIRSIILRSISADELSGIAIKCLAGVYKEIDAVPTELEKMTFDNYISIIGHGEGWDKFHHIFGPSRARAAARFKEVRDIRNDLFHFKRAMTQEDANILSGHRNWLLIKIKQGNLVRQEIGK